MNRISLTVQDDSKLELLLELLKNLDFVEIHKPKNKKVTKHNFFDSAGIWKSRNISAETLRESAWKRNP